MPSAKLLTSKTFWYFCQVLKCLNQFILNFPAIVETHFVGILIKFPVEASIPLVILIHFYTCALVLHGFWHYGDISVIVGPLWQTFVSSLKVYERSSIEGVEDSYDGRYDSDGAEKSLESFIIQVNTFVTFLVMFGHGEVGSKRNWWLITILVLAAEGSLFLLTSWNISYQTSWFFDIQCHFPLSWLEVSLHFFYDGELWFHVQFNNTELRSWNIILVFGLGCWSFFWMSFNVKEM